VRGNVCATCRHILVSQLQRNVLDLRREEAAALLGIGDHVGQIRPGYAADFVAVDGDPLDDLAAMRTISLVVQGGRAVRDDPR
jgi:cytosine/adenosine deaminase-related metal-dependent hydrolase